MGREMLLLLQWCALAHGLSVGVKPPSPTAARLTVVQVTDVYTLENFPRLKTLLHDVRATNPTTISMLTGDFLAPYLLSSIDKGHGMMRMINETPIDYLTWGNHEADIDHKEVCGHVRGYRGKWINSNMLDHEAMDAQQEYDVVEVVSADGTQTRRVGLVACLSDDPALYANFKAPGAFGGATIDCPWATLHRLKAKLEDDERCDLVVPLQHTYVPDDHKTCREFDVPVILSGHDHHKVDEVVDGTRLLKPGLDAIYATVLTIEWASAQQEEPTIAAEFVPLADFEADAAMAAAATEAYEVLAPLRNTELARVPAHFRPLSSSNSRGRVCSMGRLVCTLIRNAVNTDRSLGGEHVDGCILMGGNIRGGADYSPESFFSLETLEAEVKPEEVVGIVEMPGWLLSEGVRATHRGDPIPGWFQYGDGIEEEGDALTMVGGRPLEKDEIYRIVTKVGDLTNGQSKPFTEYYTSHPEKLPPKGNYLNIHSLLMSYFARNLWHRMWENIHADDEDGVLDALDLDGDGQISVEEIHAALARILGMSTDCTQMALAKYVHRFADVNGHGEVTRDDLLRFVRDEGLFSDYEDGLRVRA